MTNRRTSTGKPTPKGCTPWQPGQSGNPAGSQTGSRHRVSIAVENLMEGEHEVITRKCIELAKGGDLTAIRLVLERICPPRRDRRVNFSLGKLERPEDAVKAIAALADGITDGHISPGEAADLTKIIVAFKEAFETAAFNSRLDRLEGNSVTLIS